MLQCRFDELVEFRFIFISGGRCNGLLVVELRIGIIRIPSVAIGVTVQWN